MPLIEYKYHLFWRSLGSKGYNSSCVRIGVQWQSGSCLSVDIFNLDEAVWFLSCNNACIEGGIEGGLLDDELFETLTGVCRVGVCVCELLTEIFELFATDWALLEVFLELFTVWFVGEGPKFGKAVEFCEFVVFVEAGFPLLIFVDELFYVMFDAELVLGITECCWLVELEEFAELIVEGVA